MKKIILVVLIVMVLFPTQIAMARPDEPYEPPIKLPKWATVECLTTISKIVQHEVGAMKSDEVFHFMAEQIMNDLAQMKCESLTNWRWKIGPFPASSVSEQVKRVVLKTAAKWPKHKFKTCKFIGSLADISVWDKYGYNTKIGFKRTIGRLTVIGVDCK